jgi:hypothetical protein
LIKCVESFSSIEKVEAYEFVLSSEALFLFSF